MTFEELIAKINKFKLEFTELPKSMSLSPKEYEKLKEICVPFMQFPEDVVITRIMGMEVKIMDIVEEE